MGGKNSLAVLFHPVRKTKKASGLTGKISFECGWEVMKIILLRNLPFFLKTYFYTFLKPHT